MGQKVLQLKHFYQNIPGWFSYRTVYEQAVREAPDPAHFVEVGCWKGRSTAFLAVEIINSGKAISLTCVDTWLGSDEIKHKTDPDVREKRLFEVFSANIEPAARQFDLQKLRFHILRKPSTNAALDFTDGSLDFVMIDAAHDYANILADILAWWPKLKPGGVMAGDDYHFRGVKQAVTEFFGGAGYKIDQVQGSGTGRAWRVCK